MSKIHTTVRVGVDGSLTLPAFFMRGMGYEPGEEVPITTPANQYICDCDANRLLVTRTCDDAECTGYTSSGMVTFSAPMWETDHFMQYSLTRHISQSHLAAG